MRIKEVGVESLHRYAEIPIAFDVESVLRIELMDGGLGGIILTEEKVNPPYRKDYDALDGDPASWPDRFDISNWGIFLAVQDGRAVGGAAVAYDMPVGMNMLEGRRDIAVLCDIRVRPEHRGSGIGGRLFRHAAEWARRRGCSQFIAETQNINVPACRFYASQGCQLGGINTRAYASNPATKDEVMLLWYLEL
ncbi:MAG: GNAT family N-acetyltransferase [Chloroflexi bacterium]|nr:GNAT family N-acetyltransferase [Chloroflexota bacterium]